jgi:hypothetical protein
LVERRASDMALDWRREMDERSIDTGRAKSEEEIHWLSRMAILRSGFAGSFPERPTVKIVLDQRESGTVRSGTG